MNNDKAKAEILDKCSQSVECLARGKVLDLVGTLDAAQTSPETSTLLPCPWCGNTPTLTPYNGRYDRESYCVHCKTCDLSLDGDATPEEAVVRWNCRFDFAPTAQQWQPINTNPFVSAKRYLITEGDRLAIPFVGFRVYKAGPWFHDGFGEVYPTHWMDLPDTSSISSTGGNSQANTTGGTFEMKPAALTITPPEGKS